MRGGSTGAGLAWLALALLVTMASLLAAGPAVAGPGFKNLQSGSAQSLDTHRVDGKWLVVMIWASDCEICDREIGSYQAFHDRHREKIAKVVGITLDGEARLDQALRFIADHRIEFVNLIGEPEAVVDFYQSVTGSRWIGTPTFLFYGPDGELKAKQVGAVPPEMVEEFIAASTVAQ